MTIEKAMQRMFWRIQNGKFEPNENDLQSITFIAEWINREKQIRINQNRYFGKILIYTLMREIDFFEDSNLAEVKIHDILNHPINYWYDRFRLLCVTRELTINLEILGIDHITKIWDRNKDNNGYLDVEKIQQEGKESDRLLNENKEALIKSINLWSQKEVNDKLNNFISELLNEYGNMP